MEKYCEYLFDAGADNIKECLQHLTEEDIESCCEYKIFNRGFDYFNDGRVEQIWFNNKANTISAEVIGTKEYSVEIYLDNEEVHGTCSCEYYGVCKHIIAVMMCIVVNGIEYIGENDLMQLPTIKALDFLKSHLQELSKEELINLVMKFAPKITYLKSTTVRLIKKTRTKFLPR